MPHVHGAVLMLLDILGLGFGLWMAWGLYRGVRDFASGYPDIWVRCDVSAAEPAATTVQRAGRHRVVERPPLSIGWQARKTLRLAGEPRTLDLRGNPRLSLLYAAGYPARRAAAVA